MFTTDTFMKIYLRFNRCFPNFSLPHLAVGWLPEEINSTLLLYLLFGSKGIETTTHEWEKIKILLRKLLDKFDTISFDHKSFEKTKLGVEIVSFVIFNCPSLLLGFKLNVYTFLMIDNTSLRFFPINFPPIQTKCSDFFLHYTKKKLISVGELKNNKAPENWQNRFFFTFIVPFVVGSVKE